MIEGSGPFELMDPDSEGQKTYESATLNPCYGTGYGRIRNLVDNNMYQYSLGSLSPENF
jgi:hypothetical protein